jgi:hypothetical protein
VVQQALQPCQGGGVLFRAAAWQPIACGFLRCSDGPRP